MAAPDPTQMQNTLRIFEDPMGIIVADNFIQMDFLGEWERGPRSNVFHLRGPGFPCKFVFLCDLERQELFVRFETSRISFLSGTVPRQVLFNIINHLKRLCGPRVPLSITRA